MKKKIHALLLCVLLLCAMLPTGGIAEVEAPAQNLIPNGGFEDDFTSISVTVNGADPMPTVSIPASGWQVYKGNNDALLTGMASQETSVTFGEGEEAFTLTPAEGTKFLKLTKTTGSRFGILYPLSSTLTVGAKYKLEAYIYVSEDNTAGTCGLVANVNRGGLYGDVGYTWNTTDLRSALYEACDGGWAKIEKEFTYEAGALYFSCDITEATSATTVCFDGISITPFVASNVVVDQDFEAIGSALEHRMRFNRTVSNAVDPADSTNKVMYAQGSNAAVSFFPKTHTTASTTMKTWPTYNETDVLKLTFRLYVPAQQVVTENEGFQVYPRFEHSSTNYARCGKVFTTEDVGKWIYFECYGNAYTAQPYNWYLEFVIPGTNSALALNHYVDDIKIEKVAAGGFVSTLKADTVSKVTKNGVWQVAIVGTKRTEFAKTEIVKPVIGIASGTISDKALAIATIYKTEDGVKTLKDIKITPLSRVTASGLANGSVDASQIGVTVGELDMDLDTLDLADGTYTISYYLWSFETLSPIIDSCAFTVKNA